MMYEDVIKLIKTNMEMQIEDEIMRAVQRVGVTVDKDELLKALEYDRRQYDKGYSDGRRDAVVHGKWFHVGRRIKGGVDWYRCSNCGGLETGAYVLHPYCSLCGARMDGGKNE